MGKKLYELAPEPKELFQINGGDHNDLPFYAGESYFDKPRDFLLKLGTQTHS
jgi:hypothetical protein